MTTKTRTNPAAPQSDPASDEAPGVRTEAEVKADEQAANEAAAESAPPGATGDPTSDALNVEESDKLVHYVRESDGTVQSVNEGTAEHRILDRSGEWEQTSRAKAKAAKPRTFVRTAKAKA